MITELGHPPRSHNVYFANNEQASLAVLLRFILHMPNII